MDSAVDAIQNEDAIAVTGTPYTPYRCVNHADEMFGETRKHDLRHAHRSHDLRVACIMFLGLSLYYRPYDLHTTSGHATCMVGVRAFDISNFALPYATPAMSTRNLRVCTVRYTHIVMVRTP